MVTDTTHYSTESFVRLEAFPEENLLRTPIRGSRTRLWSRFLPGSFVRALGSSERRLAVSFESHSGLEARLGLLF